MNEKTSKQKRYTFESIKENSRELRRKILLLREHNIPIDDDEKEEFLNLLDGSTLGINVDEDIIFRIDEKDILVSDFQFLMRCFVEYDKAIVHSDFFYQTFGRYIEPQPIGKIWEQILYNLNHLIPKALETGAKMSKEVIDLKRTIPQVKTKEA